MTILFFPISGINNRNSFQEILFQFLHQSISWKKGVNVYHMQWCRNNQRMPMLFQEFNCFNRTLLRIFHTSEPIVTIYAVETYHEWWKVCEHLSSSFKAVLIVFSESFSKKEYNSSAVCSMIIAFRQIEYLWENFCCFIGQVVVISDNDRANWYRKSSLFLPIIPNYLTSS